MSRAGRRPLPRAVYQEKPAAPRYGRGYGFDQVWTQVLAPGAPPYAHRVLPDGRIDLIWWAGTGEIQVAGPDTGPQLADLRPGDRLVGLRFLPGMAPPALGVPADAIRDARPSLRDLWGDAADRLADSLSGEPDPAAALAAEAAARIRAGRPADPAAVRLAPALTAELGRSSVRAAADLLGFSERQLRRRSLAMFGYGPKTLQRILRFQRALRLVRDGSPAAEAAYETGYADQAHLANEVRDLAGVPLTTLLTPATRTEPSAAR